MNYFLNPKDLKIESKNPRDFVSEADRLVEQMIRARIGESYPDNDIVGEEGGGAESDAFWSVDPIDGTSNFLAGIPLWGVSVGFCEQGTPTVGAICIPMLNILLSANQSTPGIRHNTDQHRIGKSEPLDTVSNLAHLRLGMPPGIARIGPQRANSPHPDLGSVCVHGKPVLLGPQRWQPTHCVSRLSGNVEGTLMECKGLVQAVSEIHSGNSAGR